MSHAAMSDRPDPFDSIIGDSPAMRRTRAQARRLAACPRIPVLLRGETGVGKEVFARAIHEAGCTPDAPFVAVNCGALARDLLASELFGYADGAYTGARRGGAAGKLAAADGGTLFLDEFGELPLALQPHLLRALESGEYQRVGDVRTQRSSFRLLTATNLNLEDAVAHGRFRRDLYYRAAVTVLDIPPLRERERDVLALVAHFQTLAMREYDLPVKSIESSTLDALLAHDWPGNVRELKNAVAAATLAAEGRSIGARHLPFRAMAHRPAPEFEPVENLRTLEVRAIRAAMAAQNGNLSGAARTLGLAKSTLHAKLKRYGIARNCAPQAATA